jgi:RNA polymerase sigma-70 factor (ECF subfamily)
VKAVSETAQIDTRRDDAELVESFRRGRMAAYEELFERYSARIYGYIRRLTGAGALAEDFTQEVFLRAFRELRRLPGPVNFAAWAYRVATNLCHDHFRRMARREAAGPPPRPAIEDVERALLRRERSAQLEAALGRLPVDYRAALLLKYVEGLSYRQVGAVLLLSEAAVTSLLYRARVEMRRLLG